MPPSTVPYAPEKAPGDAHLRVGPADDGSALISCCYSIISLLFLCCIYFVCYMLLYLFIAYLLLIYCLFIAYLLLIHSSKNFSGSRRRLRRAVSHIALHSGIYFFNALKLEAFALYKKECVWMYFAAGM
jgi:hypothetical protein